MARKKKTPQVSPLLFVGVGAGLAYWWWFTRLPNPGPVADYKGGKHKSFGFLVGQAMKASRGKANPQLVNKLLKKKLSD